MIKSVTSVRWEALTAKSAAEEADNAWQAELDRQGIDRYSKAARGVDGSKLCDLYERKLAADEKRHELTSLLSRYQDPNQL